MQAHDIAALVEGRHPDAFSVLGMHTNEKGQLTVSAFIPSAQEVAVLDTATDVAVVTLNRVHASGLFEAWVPKRKARFSYRLKIIWESGVTETIDDPYRFPPLLSATDAWLLAEGTHLRTYEVLGAHPRQIDGVDGVAFSLWAPAAQRVSVIGDFNYWDGRRHPMRLRRECGVWELFIPGVKTGQRYKYEIRTESGEILQKADPHGFAAELRPATASIVSTLPPRQQLSEARCKANAMGAPISIYEVHATSWRSGRSGDVPFPDWHQLADTLVPYVRDLGFTHVELLPIAEYPFDGSWGYQPVGLYAPTARLGPPEGLQHFVERAHAAGLGVIIDWVPAHFPSDAHGLARFDGTHLYEHADPREGFHPDWNTLIYNVGRNEVRAFLISNALYWFERWGVDGLRVDAVASMLYRDYSRKAGEWIPNIHGGRENLETIAFLKRMNEVVGEHCPGAITIAEESTAWPGVSRPTYSGGLGFHYKWNMGWMHDTLQYIARDPVHRKHHHNDLTFGLMYAFTENFVLPLSHDEVVHGKGSLITRMPGDHWQRFANLRAYYGFMWTHPGKKLLFMGGELAQWREWSHEGELDWALLDHPAHAGIHSLIRDLNRLYRDTPALHERDSEAEGFQWLALHDADTSAIAYARYGKSDSAMTVTVCNFTPEVRHHYRIGVPRKGRYREILNTDAAVYGGSNIGNPELHALPDGHAGQPHALSLTLPPLATVVFDYHP